VKVTVDSINHVVQLLVGREMEAIYEVLDKDQDNDRIMSLGYIKGIIDCANALKEQVRG